MIATKILIAAVIVGLIIFVLAWTIAYRED